MMDTAQNDRISYRAKQDDALDVIIVDDDEIIRTVLSKRLTDDGFNVTAVKSGEEMLDIIGRQTFDIVLLDTYLLGLDGLSLLREVKPRFPGLEIIIITGKASLDSAVNALRYGGEEFVILLPDTDHGSAIRLAEGIRQHIESGVLHGPGSQPANRITVSIGVASFPDDGTDALSLIREADKSLYTAKARGKNMVCGPA